MPLDFHNLRLPSQFQGFNPREAFRNYERNLPHWRQPGATYFLTFRLHDSLPASVLRDAHQQQEIWRSRLAHERSINDGAIPASTLEDYEAFQLRTYRQLESLMDNGYGECWLKQPALREIVNNALLHFDGDRYDMHGFAVMPNHVHLAVRPLGEWQPEELLQSWKGFTARSINKQLNRSGQVWQHDAWNRLVRNDEHWFRVMRYVIRNPTKAKLWSGESTVWVNPRLLDSSGGVVREEPPGEEPW